MRRLRLCFLLLPVVTAAMLITACLEDAETDPSSLKSLGWTHVQPPKVGPTDAQIEDEAASVIAIAAIYDTVHDAGTLAEQGLANHDLAAIDKAISLLPHDEWYRDLRVAELVAKGRADEARQAASELLAVISGPSTVLSVDKDQHRTYYTGLLRAFHAAYDSRPNALQEEKTRLRYQFCRTLLDFTFEFADAKTATYARLSPGPC